MRQAGYLVVRTFEYCYLTYNRPSPPNVKVYGIPRTGVPPSQAQKKYRGVHRDPLLSVPEHLSSEFSLVEPEAQFRLEVLESKGEAHDSYIAGLEAAASVRRLLNKPELWELISVTVVTGTSGLSPVGDPLGYDVAYYGGDHYSALANSMFFPSWWGTDEEGKLYLEFYELLNAHGLFERPEDARHFLEFYLKTTSDTGEYLEILRINSTETDA
jgi:hypothetical protein